VPDRSPPRRRAQLLTLGLDCTEQVLPRFILFRKAGINLGTAAGRVAITGRQVLRLPVLTYPHPLSSSLVEILLRASTIAQDRRKTRYPRLRKAVADGLEDASVLSAKQPKSKRRKLNNVGVDPQLPDDVAARLINLQKRDGQSKNNQTYLPGSQPSADKNHKSTLDSCACPVRIDSQDAS
jgi:hypothetical protein